MVDCLPSPAALPQGADARTLRVAFFSDAAAGRNGTGTYYQDLVAALEDHLSAVALFEPGAAEAGGELSLPLPGDTTQRLGLPRPSRLRAAMQWLQPHVVVAATPGPYGLLGARYARAQGSALISGYHTDFDHLSRLYWGSLGRRVLAAPMRAAQRWLVRASEAVVVMAPAFVPAVRSEGARQVAVLGTPLDPLFLAPPLAAPPERIERLCFIGRLAREKNLESVVEAARAWPQLSFELAGDGPLRGELEAAARACPNLRLHGWLDRPGVRALLDASDLLLLPSHAETFGSIALEAMARGRPPLVTAAAGIHAWPELAEGLFRQGSEEPLSGALGRLQELPANRLRAVAVEARQAAFGLHQRTIAEWVALLGHYAREPA
ncbi:MAG: glycosyltransferase [Halorhodospira sp.]